MDSSQKQVWLCLCVDRIYGMTCRAETQWARLRSSLVGVGRWTSLQHEHLVKFVSFPPAMLAADARDVPYRRWLVSFKCGRCLAGARSSFRRGYFFHAAFVARG